MLVCQLAPPRNYILDKPSMFNYPFAMKWTVPRVCDFKISARTLYFRDCTSIFTDSRHVSCVGATRRASITSDSRKVNSTVLLCATVKRDVNGRRFETVKRAPSMIFCGDKWYFTCFLRRSAYEETKARRNLKKNYCVRRMRGCAANVEPFTRACPRKEHPPLSFSGSKIAGKSVTPRVTWNPFSANKNVNGWN